MPPIAARNLDRDADLFARRRVLEPLERLGGPARARPARQEGGQRRAAREVGIRVEGDVCALARGIDHGQQFGRPPLVLGKVERRMCEVHRAPGVLSQSQHLSVRLDRLCAIAAVVRRIIRARVSSQDTAQRAELARARVHPRRVGQAARHADRAVLHCRLQERDLLLDLRRRRLVIVRPHSQQTEVALRDEHGHVRRCPVPVQGV